MKKMITTGMLLGMTSVIYTDVSFADNINNLENIISCSNNTFGTVNVASDDVLNLRVEPNANSKIIREMKPNTRIEILDKTNSWYKVKYDGVTGYASGRYIILESSSVSSNGKVSTKESNLNVRNKADINSTVVGKLKSGTIVEIKGDAVNGWYPINYQNTTRYISKDYVQLMNSNGSSNASYSDKVESVIGKIATVNASTLNIRTGAGTNYSVINKIYRGETIKIIESNTNGWYKVSLTSGATGWCSGEYLSNFREGKLPSVNNGTNNSQTVVNASQKATKVIELAKTKLGCPYNWGAEGPDSFDCSGFTYYIYKNVLGITLPRTSKTQSTYGTYVSKENLQPGDLVFFDNNYGSNINHVGIYIGNNEMIHSPRSGDVVKIQKIDTNYYKKAYVTARRVF